MQLRVVEETRCAAGANDLKPWPRSALSSTPPYTPPALSSMPLSGTAALRQPLGWLTLSFSLKRFPIPSSVIQPARSATRLPGPLHRLPPPRRGGGVGAPDAGRWMERHPRTHLLPAGRSRLSLSARLSAGAARCRLWPAGGAVGSRRATAGAGRELLPPRCRPPAGTQAREKNPALPWRETEEGQPGSLGGGQVGGLVSNRGPFKLPEKCTGMRQGPVPRAVGCVAVAGRRSGGCTGGRGIGGQTSGACVPRRSAGTPAAPRQRQLRGFLGVLSPTTISGGGESCGDPRRGAVGAQSCSNRSRRLRGPTVMSVQPQVPALALELFASPPEPGLAGPGSRDSPRERHSCFPAAKAISGRLAAVGSTVLGLGRDPRRERRDELRGGFSIAGKSFVQSLGTETEPLLPARRCTRRRGPMRSSLSRQLESLGRKE